MLNTEDLTPAVEPRRLPAPDRHSTPTPLDVRHAKFRSAMRGYERAEVNAFLLGAADGYEQATRENERLRHELMRLEGSLRQYRELESTLKGALMIAQKVADDMKETASLEAARIVREAEGRAQMIAQQAQAKADDARREIDALRLERRESELALESMIAALHSTLEFVRKQDQGDTRIVPHRPFQGVAQAA